MIKASEGAIEIDQRKATQEGLQNADRWSAIWYEAYQNHASTAAFQATQAKRRAALVKIQTEASKLEISITTMKNNVALAKAKLEKAE